jgi:hypothetical protein
LNKEQSDPKPVGAFSGDFVEVGPAPGTARIKINNRAGCAIFLVAMQQADGSYLMLDGFNTMEFVVGGCPAASPICAFKAKREKKPVLISISWHGQFEWI